MMVNLIINPGEDTEVCIINPLFADCYGDPPIIPEIGECIYVDFDPLSLPGDINGDDWFDVTDIIAIVTIIMEGDEPSVFEFYIADFNDDQIIDILDFISLILVLL